MTLKEETKKKDTYLGRWCHLLPKVKKFYGLCSKEHQESNREARELGLKR